ncbi:DUF1416 domain-containing protein [Salinispora fenicalii]|uniref:DUF1416 domain-containing protein n=1 Tax=Salinispora fenicalii TaxID=1137263 RepID=UPI000485C282|nr:DUF1416 domain-containing protein [Salinispora fenicalii]
MIVMTVSTAAGCAAPDQAAPLPTSLDLEKETVITGVVRDAAGTPVTGAYVRLLDSADEFTAEVVTSPAGQFRFFAAPGTWRLRALSRHGNGDTVITASRGVNEATVPVAVD